MSERKGDPLPSARDQAGQPITILGSWVRTCGHWDAAVLPPPLLYMEVRSLDEQMEAETDFGMTVAEIRMEGRPQCAQCGEPLEGESST